jgi:hypothetical protein
VSDATPLLVLLTVSGNGQQQQQPTRIGKSHKLSLQAKAEQRMAHNIAPTTKIRTEKNVTGRFVLIHGIGGRFSEDASPRITSY